MATKKKEPLREHRAVTLLDGVDVGTDPDLAAEVMRAVTREAQRQVYNATPRADVEWVAVGKAFVGLRLSDADPSKPTREMHFRQAKVVYRTVVQETLHRLRVRPETVVGALVTRTGEEPKVK
jgi:hypothetical protein